MQGMDEKLLSHTTMGCINSPMEYFQRRISKRDFQDKNLGGYLYGTENYRMLSLTHEHMPTSGRKSLVRHTCDKRSTFPYLEQQSNIIIDQWLTHRISSGFLLSSRPFNRRFCFWFILKAFSHFDHTFLREVSVFSPLYLDFSILL